MPSLGDAVTNAIDGLTNSLTRNVVNVGRGTNPLSQPQVANLLGFNIPGVPLISTRDYFLLQLQSWITSIPLQTQWIAVIDSFPAALRTNILQNLERVDGARRGYDIDKAKSLLTSYPFQKVIGCVFAQGAQIPYEKCRVDDAIIENNRGFIPGIISTNRLGYADNPLRLSFLETNTSIVDNIFRPWIMLASHYGQVARPGDVPGYKSPLNVKSNITLLCYSRSYQNISQIPRKVYTFYNVVPTDVLNIQFDYANEPDRALAYEVNFSYTNYTIENSFYFPLANIINTITQISNGAPLTVSPLQNSQNFPQNAAGFF